MKLKDITIILFLFAVGIYSMRLGPAHLSFAENNDSGNLNIGVNCTPSFDAFVPDSVLIMGSYGLERNGTITFDFEMNEIEDPILNDSISYHSIRGLAITDHSPDSVTWGSFQGPRIYSTAACQGLVNQVGYMKAESMQPGYEYNIYLYIDNSTVNTEYNEFVPLSENPANIWTNAQFSSDNIRVVYGDDNLPENITQNPYSLGFTFRHIKAGAGVDSSQVWFDLGVY